MGQYAPDPNYPSMIHFKPDNTANEFYLQTDGSLGLLDAISEAVDHFMQFPESRATMSQHYNRSLIESRLQIRAERIHTRCIYYDCHDPSDWDDFLVFTLENEQ